MAEEYAETIVSLEKESAKYGFLKEYWQEATGILEEQIQKGNSWTKSSGTNTGAVYNLFEDEFKILDSKGFEKSYHIEIGMEELNILRERIRKHFERGYDETELIAILKSKSEESPLSSRELRERDDTPTETPYINQFGSLNNAYWRAGIETEERYDREILIEEYLKKLHEENIGTDLLLHTPSLGSDSMPSNRTYRNHFKDIEELRVAASSQLIADIDEELENWHFIIHSPLNLEIGAYSGKTLIDQANYAPENPEDLKSVYPRLKAEHPRVRNRDRVRENPND